MTCFIHELENNNVEIVLNYQINDIVYSNSNKLFYLKSEYKTFESEKVIVATGRMSAPQFGSMEVFSITLYFGHSLIELKPGLVPIIINDDFFSVDNLGAKLSGTVVLENAQGIEMSKKYFGEIIFKNEMLTGIPIFQISNFVHRYLDEKIPIYLHIDPFPSYTENQVEEIILKD